MGTTETVPWDEIINLDCLETLRFCISTGAAFKTRKTQYPKSFGINKVLNQPLKHEHTSTFMHSHISIPITRKRRFAPASSPFGRLRASIYTSAHSHISSSAHQHISTSAHQHPSTSSGQAISTSAHQHINSSAHQHISTSAHQFISTSAH